MISNFDLSSTLFALIKRDKKVFIQLFPKSWRGVERVAPHTALSFVSFSLCLFWQRKAAKDFCYQNLLDAFSFETIGTKEKALQKENAVFCAHAAQAPLLKKWTKQQLGFVRTMCALNPNLSLNTTIILAAPIKYCQSMCKIQFFYLLIQLFMIQWL